MKIKLLLIALFAAASAHAFQDRQQQNTEQEAPRQVIHRVALGETMVMIAKKYMVTPHDIYELNPDAVNGLNAGMGLKIPLDKKVKVEHEKASSDYEMVAYENLKKSQPEPAAKPQQERQVKEEPAPKAISTSAAVEVAETATITEVSHKVVPGETLTGLARKYNTSIADITAANERKLRNGLQAGQVLTIPAQGDTASAETPAVTYSSYTQTEESPAPSVTGTVKHHVVSGETLTGLARKYNTTIADITAANEKVLRRGLQTGQVLTIPSSGSNTEIAETTTETTTVETVAEGEALEHKVQSGETLTGIARKYNTSIEAITAANRQKLKRGLQAGQVISIVHRSSE